MAAQSRTTLKTYFNTGDTPTETQFANLIDSMQNITDDGTALTDITAESIGDLSDVGDATATSGNVLVADGDSWESRALTESDISDLGTYLTDVTGESIGDLSDVTITTGAQGDILYNNGSAWVNLAPGTNGQYLQTQGAAANPQWATLSGGGDMAAATYDPATISEQLVGLTASQTLTNKTIDADNNTISNIALGAEATGALGDLSDVTEDTVGDNEVLQYVTDHWENQTLTEAGIADASHTHVEADITDLGTYLTDITGEDLGDLADVTIDTPADNEVLAWNGTDTWINQTAAEAGLAAASHAHAASDITSGTLAHEQGGIEADISAVTTGDILAGTGAGTIGIVAASGASDGDVLTLQGDGTVAYETPAAGGGGGPRGFTYVIAASDSDDNTGVDATCDGTADDVEIQAGIDAVNTAGGGTVMLLDGTYEIDSTVNLKSNVALKGQGYGTVLTRSDATDFLSVATSTTANNVVVGDISFDGNEQSAELFDYVGYLSNAIFQNIWAFDFTTTQVFDLNSVNNVGVNLRGVKFENCTSSGTFINTTIVGASFNIETQIVASSNPIISLGSNCSVTNSSLNCLNFAPSGSYACVYANGSGITVSNNSLAELEGSVNGIMTRFAGNVVSGNTFGFNSGSGYTGIFIISNNGGGASITNNSVINGGESGTGIYLNSSDNVCVGNYCQDGEYGIRISGGTENTVIGNKIYTDGNYGIFIGSSHNIVSGNQINGYDSSVSAIYFGYEENNIATSNLIHLEGSAKAFGFNTSAYMNSDKNYILKDNLIFGLGANYDSTEVGVYETDVVVMVNGSGGASADGQVVVRAIDSVNGRVEFNTTTTAGDPTVVGVCIDASADNTQARVVKFGPVDNLKVDGTDDIAVGDPLSTFTSAGIAQKAATGETVFAIAMEAYTADDSNGVINAIVIEPYIMP